MNNNFMAKSFIVKSYDLLKTAIWVFYTESKKRHSLFC